MSPNLDSVLQEILLVQKGILARLEEIERHLRALAAPVGAAAPPEAACVPHIGWTFEEIGDLIDIRSGHKDTPRQQLWKMVSQEM